MEFVRVNRLSDFNRIPRYLFEQMRYKEFEVDRVYKYAPSFLPSYQTWFYTLNDDHDNIKGVLWATIEPVQNVLVINLISVDKECQGGAIEKCIEFLMDKVKKAGLEPEIWWITKRHKYLSKTGWENTGKTLMKLKE